MTATRKRPRATVPPIVPVLSDRLGRIEESAAKLREANHAKADREAIEAAMDHAAERAFDRVMTRQKGGGDAPAWLKTAGPLAGLALACIGILTAIWTLGIAPINVRLGAQETARTEQAAATVALNSRLQLAETGLAKFDTQFNTATRIRDQQQQAFTDRLRGLELSDQTGSQQVNALAQSLAGLVARMEEMLRRQERLENRLGSGGARNGSDDTPAAIIRPHFLL